MILPEDVKQRIADILDSKEFMSDLYEGLDKETRDRLGMFYTPAKVCIQMLEKYDCDSFADKTVLDPTCGSGNLLIAVLIAGADSDKLFGNEYDATAVELCRKRLNRACDILRVPRIRDWQIHQGNALHEFALREFMTDYDLCYFDSKTQPAARERHLSDPAYNAYKDSETYMSIYKDAARAKRKAELDKSLSTIWFM